jgi:hypothetical protein
MHDALSIADLIEAFGIVDPDTAGRRTGQMRLRPWHLGLIGRPDVKFDVVLDQDGEAGILNDSGETELLGVGMRPIAYVNEKSDHD